MAGVDHPEARAFAIARGFIGAGWGLNDSPEAESIEDGCTDLEDYLAATRRLRPDDSSLEVAAERIANGIAIGDYCWMYDTGAGEYWCCIITGAFVYRQGADFDRHDLHMLRPCRWARVGVADAVPGVIRRAFAAPFGTITRLTTGIKTAIEAAEVALGIREQQTRADLFAAASPDDLEDIVGLYLQTGGWSILPSTSKTSMAGYEFVLVNDETGKRAGVQVKSGRVGNYTPIVADEFDKFFVFLADTRDRLVTHDERVERLSHDCIQRFTAEAWHRLPRRLQLRWKPDISDAQH